MERKFLEELGIEKDTIDKIMAQNGKDIETLKTSSETIAKDRDVYKAQLEDVGLKLKAFDGVDVSALKGEIETLKTDLKAKEADFKAQLADRDFDALLSQSITQSKGKNEKTIKPLLDIETLKASKNQKEDLQAAIKALTESEPYLFSSDGKESNTTVRTGGHHTEPGGTESDAFTAAFMKSAGVSTPTQKGE